MPKKKITFKQRIRRNDLKSRHNLAAGLRKRMNVTRRSQNRFDRLDNNSRPMEEMMSDIADGTAVPSQEFGLDPRSLTDMLLHAAAPQTAGTAPPGGSAGKEPSADAGAPPTRHLLPTSLPASHPLALRDTRVLEEEERRQRTEHEARLAARENKNMYRHSGQPYLFWERVGLHPRLLQALRAMRFSHPTPVQQEVLAHVMNPSAGVARLSVPKPTATGESSEGAADALQTEKKRKKRSGGGGGSLPQIQRDVIVSAETGSGKTLVFALPVLDSLLKKLDEAAAAVGAAFPPSDGTEGSAKTATRARDSERKRARSASASARPADTEAEGKDVSEAGGPTQAPLAKRTGKKRRTGTGSSNGVEAEAAPAPQAAAAACSSSSAPSSSPASRVPLKEPTLAAAAPSSGPNAHAEDYTRRVMHTLIVSPTRELAIQIAEAFTQLTRFSPHVSIGCIVGGMAQEKQQRVLNRHPHVLICTPGRLWDLVEKNEGCYLGHSISRRLHFVVLDEADKLLQSGKFEQLKGMLERIHGDTLPAGFVQEREEGAEVGEAEMTAGRWDEERQRFVPFTKDNKADQAAGTSASAKPQRSPRHKKNGAKDDTHTEEEQLESDEDENGEALAGKSKKSVSKRKVARSTAAEEDSADDSADEQLDSTPGKTPRKAKDQPRPMPMPAAPAETHRVVTYVTSATLSLQTNYERKDLKAEKKVIRTTNADVMGKVLQQLEIKPSNANVFSLSQHADVAAKINETYLRCPEKSKDLYLYYFLRTFSDDRTIIFVNAISMLRRMVKVIECLGISVVGLHASMQQRQRLKFIDKFKSGSTKVLVATDIASRGLDIDGLKYVIHYQVPRTTESYIHRCGRTARCGGTGLSVLLVSASEHVSFTKLMESLGRKASEMEAFALQPTVVHQLNPHLRIALQIDKLQKEIDKSRASDNWVDRMNKAAELDVDDMKDEDTQEENRQKTKAIRILKRELELLQKKFTGSYGGKGAFRTGAQAVGAKQAEEKLRLRADRQALKAKK